MDSAFVTAKIDYVDIEDAKEKEKKAMIKVFVNEPKGDALKLDKSIGESNGKEEEKEKEKEKEENAINISSLPITETISSVNEPSIKDKEKHEEYINQTTRKFVEDIISQVLSSS